MLSNTDNNVSGEITLLSGAASLHLYKWHQGQPTPFQCLSVSMHNNQNGATNGMKKGLRALTFDLRENGICITASVANLNTAYQTHSWCDTFDFGRCEEHGVG